jgi:hypothetical protein
MHPKNIKAPARVVYGTCDRCGRHSPMCARVVWRGEPRPLMACSTCRFENIEQWYIAPGWDDGMPREHDTSLNNVKFQEWAKLNPPLTEFATDSRRALMPLATEDGND